MSSSNTENLPSPLNLHSPSTELELPACPIVDLPLELLEPIVSHLDFQDLYSLASTSKLFQSIYRLRAILMKLRRYSSCDSRVTGTDSQWEGELFCLSSAEPGQVGWTPFFMMDPMPSGFDGVGIKQSITVEVVSPEFERFDPEDPTESYLFVQHTESLVWIREEYWNNGELDKDASRRQDLNWDNDLAGRLVYASSKMLDKRFKCPECKGSREVEFGTIDVDKRYAQSRFPSAKLSVDSPPPS
ncbi:hypothetical protein RQP46_002017 [Phenoliferia psychrophenolica]